MYLCCWEFYAVEDNLVELRDWWEVDYKMEYPSSSKKPKSVDFEICFICQTDTGMIDYTNYVMKPSLASVEKLIRIAGLRYTCGDHECAALNSRVQGLTADELLKNSVSYHRHCYQNLTHKQTVDRIKNNLEEGAATGSISGIRQKKRGRPSSRVTPTSTSASPRRTREQYFKKHMCVICQEDQKDKLHNVSTENMGSQLIIIGQKTGKEGLKVRLSNLVSSSDPLTAVAEDMKYHLQCLVKEKRDIEKLEQQQKSHVKFGQVLSDLELLEIVETELNDPNIDGALNMNDIQQTYVNLLLENEFPIPEKPRYKTYLKQMILDNIPDVHFSRPPDKTKPEQVLSTKSKDSLIASALTAEDLQQDLKVLLKAAKILRRDIGNSSSWKFHGTFTDYEVPALLNTFCKHAIQGTGQVKTTTRKESVVKSATVLAQHFVAAYKSDRQVSYQTKNDDVAFRHRFETPLNVGLALDMHKNTRSKYLVEKLGQLDLAISYRKLMEIETGLANSVLQQMDSFEGVCLPPWLVKDKFVWFALDNIDFLESTPCGMNTLHGTAIAIYQSECPGKTPMKPPLEIDRSSKAQSLDDGICCEILSCEKPEPKKKKLVCKLNTSRTTMEQNKKMDTAWIIGCMDFERDNEIEVKLNAPGTWGAFNSLLCFTDSKTNVALVPPLIRSPPTDYGTLYTGLMRANNITTCVMGSGSITVVTLDLQLYDMAMKMWTEREDIRKQFLFRPGELHVVFWALAALGKYVEGSGIDQAWVEAGIYSPTTVTQILGGKHMYRALEAHMITLLALYNQYFQSFLASKPEERSYLKESSTHLGEEYQKAIGMRTEMGEDFHRAVKTVMSTLESRQIFQKLGEFESNPNKMQHFILNYIHQFETILLFVRSTRQRDLQLHMESMESLIKYFFAHDHLNYARLLPLYISTMQEIKQQHPDVWEEFMQGNFCVTKGVAGFTSIAPDHGIEQENRTLKVIGGIVGLTQNEKALDKFFLIAPELSQVLNEFAKEYSIESNDNRTQHHEITGGKLSRVMKNAAKLTSVFHEHGDPFIADEGEDNIYNLLTREVMTEKVTKDIIERDDVGQNMFEEFVKERLTEGKLSVWDKMKRRKLGTFKNANASIDITVGDKLVKMKEERGLLQRFIVIARSRPELDLKECIGTYEFGIVPRSLFAADGSLLLAYDKATILHHLELMASDEPREQTSEPAMTYAAENQNGDVADAPLENRAVDSENENTTNTRYRVIIIDGMALVNSIIKTDQMRTCHDFAQSFISILSNLASNYNEVRLVFDTYLNTSLKEQTRKKRTKGKSTYYQIRDSSIIKNISLKDFLAHIKTKAELTEYLAIKCLDHSKSSMNRLKKFIVTFGTESKGNITVPELLLSHSQEEADTLLLLHAVTISRDAEVVINSPDTDVFLLMIYMYPSLPPATSFLTGKGKLKRSISLQTIYDKLGENHASAILGFHAFTGSDSSGRFAGRTKAWCFKVFLTCDVEILEALSSLGNNDPSPEICSQLERFVCRLYRSNTYNKVNELRWFLYSNRAAEGESLPPTTGSLIPHIQRAHYITMIWKRAGVSHPCLPSPAKYGWNFDEATSHFTPVRCLHPPAPEATLNLVKCGCKCGCKGRCSCRNNNIPCTEVCGCLGYSCSNKAKTVESLMDDGLDDD